MRSLQRGYDDLLWINLSFIFQETVSRIPMSDAYAYQCCFCCWSIPVSISKPLVHLGSYIRYGFRYCHIALSYFLLLFTGWWYLCIIHGLRWRWRACHWSFGSHGSVGSYFSEIRLVFGRFFSSVRWQSVLRIVCRIADCTHGAFVIFSKSVYQRGKVWKGRRLYCGRKREQVRLSPVT